MNAPHLGIEIPFPGLEVKITTAGHPDAEMRRIEYHGKKARLIHWPLACAGRFFYAGESHSEQSVRYTFDGDGATEDVQRERAYAWLREQEGIA